MSFPHLGGVLKFGFTSSFVPISCFLFLSTTRSSESAGGCNVVELVLSSDTSASSPSYFSLASGASETAKARSTRRGPSYGRGGRETRK
jgi:hypothetical protein